MKRILIAIAFVSCANIGMAQTGQAQTSPQMTAGRPENRADDPRVIMEQAQKETDKLDKELKLTADQKKQVMNVNMNMDHQAVMIKMHEKDPEHLKQMDRMKQDQIRRILTPEQLPKFEQIVHQPEMTVQPPHQPMAK